MDPLNIGQKTETWDHLWKGQTPESEIQMWDFYGLRQWMLKFVSRYGKVVEAGCGLGRYVFYLSRLGIDIEGIDFSESTIQYLNGWEKDHHFGVDFRVGEVTALPYEDNSLSCYISLGVIEHFIEGPKMPLAEAYRVLRPGGIAVISTPSVSFNVFLRKSKRAIKNLIKRILRYRIEPEKFFQYWYRPAQLKKFVSESGLMVRQAKGGDLLYVFCERGGFSGKNIGEDTFAYKFSHRFEDTLLSYLGAQAITISVKAADRMFCFLCGENTANRSSLKKFDVPICGKCRDTALAAFYKKGRRSVFGAPYLIDPPVQPPDDEVCRFCRQTYRTDSLFEYDGFSVSVCPRCLKKPKVNILLANTRIQPIWRKRI
jgi:ubiquinone/menaquinone biosynthesis C-methylase UbiE